MLAFPSIPDEIKKRSHFPTFAPAHELKDWVRRTFIDKDAELVNPDHQHLRVADILFVWSSVNFKRQGQVVVGTAQPGKQRPSGPGQKEFIESWYLAWNKNQIPDFIITICAPYVVDASPDQICALIEHELYHCGQQKDEFGFPKYSRTTGMPKFAMCGHDVEEFVGVVKRYGDLGDPAMLQLKDALNSKPSIRPSQSKNVVCGCGARV